MKKSLLAVAVLSAFAGAAYAQSSVTLFGIVDAGIGRVSAGGRHVTGMSNSGYNSSRLGFRGVEDLGGGLRAGFWIEGALSNDDGNAAGFNFQRRSTVSLMGNFGEIRLGRDYTPSFWNTTVYDAFGTNGVGQSMAINLIGGLGLGNGTNAVRANNSIGYLLPAIGGLFGQVQYAFGENTGGIKTNNYWGGRIGYAAGPLSVAGAYGKTEGATDAADVKYMNVGGQFAFGPVTPQLAYFQEKAGSGAKVTAWEAGVLVTVGVGQIRAAYSDYDLKNSSNDWKKLAVGYVHNMSKRTALYATFARVANDGAQTKAVSNNGLSAGAAAPGGNSTGYEFGVRHSF